MRKNNRFRQRGMRQIGSACLLPGFEPQKTYAPSPVWAGSVARRDIRFRAMKKDDAIKLFHDARAYERRTRQPGKQDGKIGRNGLAVLHALIFDFMNWATGQLDPAYETIARHANISRSSVARGLKALHNAGIVRWLKRCSTRQDESGRVELVQETNAYDLQPTEHWVGFHEVTQKLPPAPHPEPGTWGEHPCGMRDPHEEAVLHMKAGGDPATTLKILMLGEPGSLAAQYAAWGALIREREKKEALLKAFPGVSA